MITRLQGLRPFRAVAMTMGVLIGAVFAAAIGEPEQAPGGPARPAHPVWNDLPAVPEAVASEPTHALEAEEYSIRSEHGVHAGIMAF